LSILQWVIFLSNEVEWDDEGIEQELRVRGEDLLGLQKELFELMTKFGLRAIRKFQALKSTPLSTDQMNQVVSTQIQFLLQTLSDQTFIDMVAGKAKREAAKSGPPDQ
jgi:hypothetical protein